jgi:hypothetical protein
MVAVAGGSNQGNPRDKREYPPLYDKNMIARKFRMTLIPEILVDSECTNDAIVDSE